MSDESVLAKVATVIGSVAPDDMSKEAKWGLAKKILAGTAVAGGMTATGIAGHAIGKKRGETVGEEKGRKKQYEQDVQKFRTHAKRIFDVGRLTGRRNLASDIQRRFSGATSNGVGNTVLPSVRQVKMPKQAGLDKMAEAVYAGWVHGEIEVEKLRTLPPTDMSKLASVVVDRMNNGDDVARILWRLLGNDDA